MPLQDVIHRWTEGAGSRVLRVFIVVVGMAGLALWYNLAAFKNLSTIEGLDSAQLARNLANGEGYSTHFIRPFSIYLLKKHRPDADGLKQGAHPDLANAPAYPTLLAGALKLMPFGPPDLSGDSKAVAYAPDRWIAGFNQLLFLVAVALIFRMALRLFDERVAWVTAAIFGGSDLLWKFSIAGQSTLLTIVLFLMLCEVLSRMSGPRDGSPGPFGWLVLMAATAGLLTGLAGLTRYSFGWLILPVVGYLAFLPVTRRPVLISVCLAVFLGVMGAWLARNHALSGTWFGTAGYAIYEGTSVFPGFELMRTVNADFSLITGGEFSRKLFSGLREILEKQLPLLGGSWVFGFFLVGLMVPFRNPALNRLRAFALMALGMLVLVQALGRTELSVDSPGVNSENLLVVLSPLVFLFGVSLFFVLLDQFGLREPGFRGVAITGFVLLMSAPLLFTLLRPVPSALSYPPYNPRLIQEKTSFLAESDWTMSDFPWAVAWYGNRPSVWFSLKYREEPTVVRRNDFAAVTEAARPVRALYLSSRTTASIETQQIWSWIHRTSREDWQETVNEWESFLVAGAYAEREVPTGFPLRQAPFGLWPELFLTDSERSEGKPIKGK